MPTDKHTDQHRPESISSVYPPRKQVFLGRLLSDIFLLVFCAVWFSWFIPTAAGIFAEVNETAGSFCACVLRGCRQWAQHFLSDPGHPGYQASIQNHQEHGMINSMKDRYTVFFIFIMIKMA